MNCFGNHSPEFIRCPYGDYIIAGKKGQSLAEISFFIGKNFPAVQRQSGDVTSSASYHGIGVGNIFIICWLFNYYERAAQKIDGAAESVKDNDNSRRGKKGQPPQPSFSIAKHNPRFLPFDRPLSVWLLLRVRLPRAPQAYPEGEPLGRSRFLIFFGNRKPRPCPPARLAFSLLHKARRLPAPHRQILQTMIGRLPFL